MEDEALIKWFKFSNEELELLRDAFIDSIHQPGSIRLYTEISQVLHIRETTPKEDADENLETN